jgi:threonine dehydratase
MKALGREELVAAHRASAGVARCTPVLQSSSLSEQCGGVIALKAECLQRTGSFKLRGALNKLRAIDGKRGVVAGSAGNHAQSLAFAARHRGVPCEVFMPAEAPISKLEAVRNLDAIVHQEGASVDDCIALAKASAEDTDAVFVHPFEDLDVIIGQAGVGIELAEADADLRRVIVPVGGGGLISGVAAALKQLRPGVEVFGVQAAACAPVARRSAGEQARPPQIGSTIADGIAVKEPGELNLSLIDRWVDEVVCVSEEAIAAAMTLLLESSKLVVEGAGAAAVAALSSGEVLPAGDGTTVAILSGGNVDVGLLASLAARAETKAGRRARLFTRIPDRPGNLVRVLTLIAESNANVLAIEHARDGVTLDVRYTGVTITIETRGPEHLEEVQHHLAQAGHSIQLLPLD